MASRATSTTTSFSCGSDSKGTDTGDSPVKGGEGHLWQGTSMTTVVSVCLYNHSNTMPLLYCLEKVQFKIVSLEKNTLGEGVHVVCVSLVIQT